MDKNKTAYKVLRQLADGRFHSGQALAKTLGITRSGVWKAIQQLNAVGLEVHAVTGKGYRLPLALELLDKSQILAALSPDAQSSLGDIAVFSSLPSTSDYLRELAQHSAHNRVCIAEYQSQGRGRRGRRWLGSYGSGIYLSVLWHFEQDAFALIGLSLVIAVAMLQALQRYGLNHALQLKWPNDILWQQRKLAGILVDLIAEPHAPCQAIIGIGLNTALPSSVLTAIDQPCADLYTATEQPPRRNQLTALMLQSLVTALHTFEQQGLSPFIAEWQRFDALRDQPVLVQSVQSALEGIMRGLTPRGELQLELPSGEIKTFLSGEVSLRRI